MFNVFNYLVVKKPVRIFSCDISPMYNLGQVDKPQFPHLKNIYSFKSLHCRIVLRIRVKVRVEFMITVIVSIRVRVSFPVMVWV